MSMFGTEKNGYKRSEVDEAVKKYEDRLTLLNDKLGDLNEKLQSAIKERDELKAREDVVERTLTDAAEIAQKVINDAKNQADEELKIRLQNDEDTARRFDEKKEELEGIRKRIEYILRSQLALLGNNTEDNGE